MTWDLNREEAKRKELQLAANANAIEKYLPTHWDKVRTELCFQERSRRQRPLGSLRAREKYLRSDIICGIKNCPTCMESINIQAYPVLQTSYQREMERENVEYLVPDPFSLLQCMELLEEPDFHDGVKYILVFQTILIQALQLAPSRDAQRLRNYFSNSQIRNNTGCCVYYFPDQHHVDTSIEIKLNINSEDTRNSTNNENLESHQLESLNSRDDRAIYTTFQWYLKAHVSKSSHFVFMVRDINSSFSVQVANKLGIKVVTCVEFLKSNSSRFRNLSLLIELAENTADAIEWYEQKTNPALTEGFNDSEFKPFLHPTIWEPEVKKGIEYFVGKLEVSSHNPYEAYVEIPVRTISQRSVSKILIIGRKHMNRSIHGDKVVIRLLPQNEWSVSRSEHELVHYINENDVDYSKQEQTSEIDRPEDQNSQIASENTGINMTAIPSGEVIAIQSRDSKSYVATVVSSMVSSSDDVALAVPMDIRIPKIRIRSQRMDTLLDKRLKVVIDFWDSDSMYPSGHYIGVIGKLGDMETEVEAILVEHCIESSKFSEAALACLPSIVDIEGQQLAECSTAKRDKNIKLLDWKIPPEEIDNNNQNRKDLRKSHRIFSVDPKGCQDIDDAMSVCQLPNGNIEVGVHIADVAYFVEHNSALDLEARARGTSVYLVNQRLDMLPACLSSDLCSLLQDRDRMAVSVFWEINSKSFEILTDKTWFGRTIIRNCASMTYEQAHRLLQGFKADATKSHRHSTKGTTSSHHPGTAGGPVKMELQDSLRSDLDLLTRITRKLRFERGKLGGLDLSKAEEVRFSLNVSELGQDSEVEVYVKENLEIHQTIAELMILANCSVAKKLMSNKTPGQALLRRHQAPSGDRFTQMIKIAQAKSVTIDTTNNYTLQHSLVEAETSGKVDAQTMFLLKSLAIRVMSEAEYICALEATADYNSKITPLASSPCAENQVIKSNYAHYGLGVDCYTHFTSPIRRYSDIIVHRQLLSILLKDNYVDKNKSTGLPKRMRSLNSVALPSLPDSLVRSVNIDHHDDDAEYDLDDILDSIDGKLSIQDSTELQEASNKAQSYDTHKLIFPPAELVPLAKHLNIMNRSAKIASRHCDELFLALYFSKHTVRLPAIITALKQNGFIVYIPKYDIRAPVYLRDKDGTVQVDPTLCGVRLVDTFPPTGAFAGAESIRQIPQAKLVMLADESGEVLSIDIQTSYDGSRTKKCSFRILDNVEVQVSCDLHSAGGGARIPKLLVLLLGKIISMRNRGYREKEVTIDANQEKEGLSRTAIPELLQALEDIPCTQNVSSHNKQDQQSLEIRQGNNMDSKTLYDLLLNIPTLSPRKLPSKKSDRMSLLFKKTKKPKPDEKPKNDIKSNKSPSHLAKTKSRGPGRTIFGNFEPALTQHYQKKFASYMTNRSQEMEDVLSISRSAIPKSSSLSIKNVKEKEQEALSRTQKLAAQKRHDRINKRVKAGK